MPEPYIRLLQKRGPLQVWEVNGTWVRSNYRDYNPPGEAFTNSGQGFQLHFIPYYDAWVDQGLKADDINFVVDNVCEQWRCQRAGESYESAIGKADKLEQRERKKAGFYIAGGKDKGPSFAFLQQIHKVLLGYVLGGVPVWLANGDIIRRRDVNFTEGGHGWVYPYLPKEIDLDDQIRPEERPKVLVHEASEAQRMRGGMAYDKAHAIASDLEYKARENPNFLADELASLGWKSKIEKSKFQSYWR